MPKAAPTADGRTLVDRFIDRIKNNRFAAVVIIAFIGIGALANLTDSTKKIFDALPSLGNSSIAGEWKADPAAYYPIGPEFMRLHLQETAGQILGSVRFSGTRAYPPRAFDVLDAKREGKKLSLRFDSGAFVSSAGGKSTPLRETIVGELVGSELHLIYQREGHGGVPVVARRLAQAGQLVEGRLAIMYKDVEYPDHRAACTQLLRDLTPPEVYKQSDPPDENGNIHCAGANPSGGGTGYEMFQSAVEVKLICPANSRKAVLEGMSWQSVKRCECDGQMVASAAKCVAS